MIDKRFRTISKLPLLLDDIFLIERYIELRADFAAGTFRDIKKLNEFLITSTFKTFSNVRHDRDRRTLNLVAEAEVL